VIDGTDGRAHHLRFRGIEAFAIPASAVLNCRLELLVGTLAIRTAVARWRSVMPAASAACFCATY
jgi:hypothetical protein